MNFRMGASDPPMRRRIAWALCRFDAMVSFAFILVPVLFAIANPATATNLNDAHLAPEKRHGSLIAKDNAPVGFPYILGAFNGLAIDQDVVEKAKARGLDVVRRAPNGATTLRNNHVETREILMGEIQHAQFSITSNESVTATSGTTSNSTSKRATSAIYISLTICSKPILNESITDTTQVLPQLDVYISTSESLQDPGPHHENGSDQEIYHSEEGYMSRIVSSESNVYVGVVAPDAGNYSGSYSYQIAASTDGLFHSVDDQAPTLHFVDSGSDTALFNTVNAAKDMLTKDQLESWQNGTAFTMFINNVNNTAISGMSRSYCALEQHSQVTRGDNLQTSITTRGRVDDGLQEQFYVTGLNRSSSYVAVLAIPGNSTNSGDSVGGGGKLLNPKLFSTKTDGNCAVIYDLEFCSDIAYAVPSNPSMNLSEIRSKYDKYAEELYTNFNYSLQQIQCNTSNESIFSMAVDCAACAASYKTWLCAVTIPQCDDFSSTSNTSAVVDRNTGQTFPNGTYITDTTLRNDPARNHSRNPNLIDKVIQPGPYKEVLPNLSICHDLTRDCPMALGFQCPKGAWIQYSYSLNGGTGLSVPSSLRVLGLGSAVASGMVWLL